MNENTDLPSSWSFVSLSVAATINPSREKIDASATQLAHFVPMASVQPEFGGIDVSVTRPFSEVIKGYTAFKQGDVLFAKITPCMENGKIAVVPALEHHLGFGSTEFHVLRATEIALPIWVAYFLSQTVVRREAQRSMTGSAGQLRVPATWLREQRIPIPSIAEQRRIVAKIEEMFSDLDAGVTALERAKANLKRYRAAVLKAAVEGKLTEAWRAEHPHTEPASKLLDRILAERRRKWEVDQLAKYAAAGKEPPKNWKEKYVEPTPPDTAGLPELPDGWCWASMEQLLCYLRNGFFQSPSGATSGLPILRINAVRPMHVDLSETRFLDQTPASVTDYFIENGDLLFTRYNGSVDLLGVAGMVRGCGERILHPDKLIRVKLILGEPMPAFVEVAANVGASRKHMAGRARTTAGQTGISGPDVREMPIPLPPLAEQRRIVEEVAERLSQIDATDTAINHSLVRAARLRQSILKQAFKGKLVPQDPTDEPASVLRERLRGSRETPEGDGKPISPVRTPGKATGKRKMKAVPPGEGNK